MKEILVNGQKISYIFQIDSENAISQNTDCMKALLKAWEEMDMLDTVDLYGYYGAERPDGAVGKLTCLAVPTPAEISPARKRPAILILPGGAYRRTSAREGIPVALRFLARGYAAFVLEYSCAPMGFPVSLREAAMAMRYIRENADAYEIDPAMVAAIGFSAGGHLCGTLGTMYDCPEVADIGPAALLRPDALCLSYPVAVEWGKTHEESFRNLSMGDPALRQRLSLDRLVRPDMPPVFLWHTRDDQTVPCRNAIILAEALDAAGVEFTFHLYRSGRHGLSNGDETVYAVYNVPPMSADTPTWLGSALSFFGEIGFSVTDSQTQL